MDRNVDQVIEEALHLSPEERLRVADRLYGSVPEDEVMAAWLDEAERRDKEWDEGNIKGFDLDDVLKEVRATSAGINDTPLRLVNRPSNSENRTQ